MGSKGGGGGGSNSNSFGFSSGTSTYTPNPQAMAAFQQSLGMANNAVSRPYEPYQGQMTAGFTPDQMAAMQGVRNMQGIAQPYINTATNLTQQAVDYSNPANFNQYSLNQYMNPYQQSVVDATMKQLAQTQAEAEQGAQSKSALQGTFGGSGQFLGRAEVARQQGLSNAQTLAQLNQSNYQQAQNQYNQQQQQAIQTAQNAAYGLGQLGNMAQSAGLTGINALLQSGGMQQQLAQQQLTGAYNQFLQEKAYPYQQAAFYSGIASGIGPSMGGTTTYSGINMGQQQQQQSGGGGGGGGMGGIGSIMSMLPAMFSDENEKTDKKKLGKDPETGLDMYAYRYKGDPKSYPKVVGPMAQDVEEKYPGFVFDVGGRKVVSDGERFMPRHSKAAGGSSAGSSSQSGSSANAPADVYAAPQATYQSAAPVSGSAQAAAAQGIDPGTAQFLKGFLDPQTADQIARSKWVSKGTQTQTAPEDSFGYFSQLARHAADGGRVEYSRGGGNAGGPWGELPAQVVQNPLSGSPQVGANFLDPKPSPGSLGDMNKDTKMMFGQNPIDSPQGFATLAAVPSASMAPSNPGAEAMKFAKAATPPKAASTEHFSKQGAEMAKSGAAEGAKGAGGGKGGGSGGGGGMPKMPSMKGEGNKAGIDKQASGNERGIPTENAPKTETQSSAEQQQQAQPESQSQDSKVVEPNEPVSSGSSPDAGGAEAGGEGFGDMGGMEGAEAAAPEAPDMADAGGMGGGMGGGMEDILGGFGGFFADGGRIKRAGGGAGGPGGPGGEGPSGFAGNDGGEAFGDIAPSGLAAAAGVGPSPLLGQPNAGLGQLTLGSSKPSDLAGFGQLKAGQETRTGDKLTKGWMQQYRDEYTGGPQKSPKEQGMPDMPGQDWYKTPLNVSDLSVGSPGKSNPGGITYTPIMTGMGGGKGGGMGGMGLFPTFTPPTNGSDYNDTTKMFQAPPTNGKVEGYFTGLDSNQVNPDTGLFNTKYMGPYYGGFYKDGGRVGMKDGGTPKLSTMDLIKVLMKQGATPQEAIMLSSIAHPESGMNPYAHNPNARTGDNSYGLFQVNMLGGMGPERLKKFGLKSANDLFDPNTNARVALQMLRERGSPKDWTTWKSGKNKPFLAQSKEAMAQYLNDPSIRNAPVNFEFNPNLPAMAQRGAYGYIAPSSSVQSSGGPSSASLPLSQDNEQHNFLMDILNGIFGEKGLIGGLFADDAAQAAPSRPAPSRTTAPSDVTSAEPQADVPLPPSRPTDLSPSQETPSPGFAPMQAEPGSRADALNKVMSGAAQQERRAETEEAPQTFASLEEPPPSDSNETVDQGAEQAAKRGGRIRKKYATDGEVKEDKEPVSQSGEVKYDIPEPVLPSSRQAAQTSQEGFGGLFGGHGGQDFYTNWKTNPLSQFIYHLGQAAEGHHTGNIGQALLASIPHAVQGTMGALQAQRAMANEEARRQHSMDFALGVNKAINESMQERAHGGVVRHGYATDGAVEGEGDFLGGLGDMFGGDEPATPEPRREAPVQAEPSQEQGGFFDNLFGGQEEPAVAPQHTPRATVAPQQEPGFLEDIFGQPEERPAAGAPQERGFLEDLFGGGAEEAPRAVAAKKAPIVATDMPERVVTPKVQPSIAPTSEAEQAPAARAPIAPSNEPVSKTTPEREAPAPTAPTAFTGPIYEHPQMRAYDRAINKTMQMVPQTKEDVTYLNNRLTLLRNEKKDFQSNLAAEREYQLKQQNLANKPKPEEIADRKAKQAEQTALDQIHRDERKALTKEFTEQRKQSKGADAALASLHEMANVYKTYQPGPFAKPEAALARYLPDWAMSKDFKNNAANYEKVRKEAMINLFDQLKTIGGQVRVAEMNNLQKTLAESDLQPDTVKSILSQGMAVAENAQKFEKDRTNWAEKNPNYGQNDYEKFLTDWLDKPENQIGESKQRKMKEIHVKGETPDTEEPSVKSEGAPSYSGPIAVNPKTGARMRLSDDGKSWVNM